MPTKYIKVSEFHNEWDAPLVCTDFETNGKDLFSPECKTLSISTSVKPDHSSIALLKDGHAPQTFLSLMKRPDIKKVVAARPFEEMIAKICWDTEIKGVIHDILTMAHILDENYYVYDVETVVEKYLGEAKYKTLDDKQRMNLGEVSEEELIEYNGKDTDRELKVYLAMVEKFKQTPSLMRYYSKFMLPVQNMFSELIFNGARIDTKRLVDTEREALDYIQKLHDGVIDRLPDEIKERHEDGGLSLTRSVIISDYLFNYKKYKPKILTEKKQEPATNEAHLKFFQKNKIVADILKWKKANKVKDYFGHLYNSMKGDNKIYPTTLFTRTKTGRTVMLNPPIQTFPERGGFEGWIKPCIVAEDGWLLGNRDLSQSQVRIAGWLAQDPVILETLKQGIDIHKKTASILLNKPVEEITDLEKYQAKAVNFGFIFGMLEWSFQKYAKNNFNLDLTVGECKTYRDKFFEKPTGYWRLPYYHKTMTKEVLDKGYVESPLGRRRRLPSVYSDNRWEKLEGIRQAINHPVQSFDSDLGLIGMFLAYEETKTHGLEQYIKPMWFIHDAILFTAKEEYMRKAMEIFKYCMEEKSKEYIYNNFSVKIGYPIDSEGKIGRNWGEMKK